MNPALFVPRVLRPISPAGWLRLFLALCALVSVPALPAQETLIAPGAVWRWRKGTNEVSSPVSAWRQRTFNDASWPTGTAPFHFGQSGAAGDDGMTIGTLLPDMRNSYRGVFLRRAFVITNVAEVSQLRLTVNYDDGFVAWINGTEVARANVNFGQPTYLSQAASSLEPSREETFVIGASAQSFLQPGTNILAVQAFNNVINGSDFRVHPSLTFSKSDLTKPVVSQTAPAGGVTVGTLTGVTVTFSKPVRGVDADDLFVNDEPALSVVAQPGGTAHTFSFASPPPGPVEFSWNDLTGITDLSGLAFDSAAEEARWSVVLADTTPPVMAERTPPVGVTVAALQQIEVRFNEAVLGVDAGDLWVNGMPATSVTGAGTGPYVFAFPSPASGSVTLEWNPAHGITDTAPTPNPFPGGSWVVTLNPTFQSGDIVINEFLAANINGLRDEDNEPQDWIEIRNLGAAPVNLLGWSLTDDADIPGKWIFPSVTLPAGGYLVVFASEKDRRAPTGGNRFHTNFKLNGLTEYLGLFNAESPRVAVTEFAPEYPEQRNDHSYGRMADGSWRYFATPTPGAANGSSAITGVAPTPHFSVGSGWFDAPFQLVITAPLDGATIRYTLDGSEPTATTGLVYSGSVAVNGNTTLRAAVFRAGHLPSRSIGRSFLFMDQVIAQPANPPGFPMTWGSGNNNFPGGIIPADYGVDLDPLRVDPDNPASAIDPVKMARLRDGLRELPVVSIVMRTDDMFGAGGLYPTSSSGNKSPNDKPCFLEMILPDGTSAFAEACGIRLRGNASRDPHKSPKHGFRITFRGDYGEADLRYRLFPDSPAERFDDLALRPDFGTSWIHWSDSPNEGLGALQRSRAARVRDAFFKNTPRDMGHVASHTRFCHVFINGLYWGTYDFTEQPTDSFAPNYFGGRKSDYDIYDQGTLRSGTSAAYDAMLGISGLSDNANYERMKEALDVPQFIDYMLLHFLIGHQDWGNNKNWYALRKRVSGPDGRFRYFPWDGENMLLNENINRVPNGGGGNDVPSGLHTKLDDNAEYRLDFADRVHRHMIVPGGALTPEANIARWQRWQAHLDKAIVGESVRWGDYRRDVHPYQNGVFDLYTREQHWLAENNRLVGSYFPGRTATVLNQLRAAGLYPDVTAPAFNQHGGRVAPGFAFNLTAPAGVIHYTTNGADPRVYGSGAVAAFAVTHNGTPVPLAASTVIKARVLHNGTWSALADAEFVLGAPGVPLRFTEIMYDPPGGDAYELVELRNIGPATLDLGGFSLQGINFIFPVGAALAPGATLLLANSDNPAAFAARYPTAHVAGWFGGSLANGGERLAVLDQEGRTVTAVHYDDGNGWPLSADGGGHSLEIIDPHGDPNAAANWRASAQPRGTPGQTTVHPEPTVVLNELLADNAATVSNGGAFPDWVELFNRGDQPADLSGWSLTDNGDPRQFVFPAGTILAAGAYLVVWCDSAFAAPGLHTGFALGRNGDQVLLYDHATNLVDGVAFGAQLTDRALGRVDGEWRLTSPTPGQPNIATPTAPASELAINEWLASPPTGDEDWVELFNRSATLPVALRGLHVGTSNALAKVHAHSFLAPRGHLRLFADELPGPDHLELKMPAAGGAIVLLDATGMELEHVTYGPQTENLTEGRLPDGGPTLVAFPGSASPSSANYLLNHTGPLLNEVLARNQRATPAPWGGQADWIELHNPGASAADLSGMTLSDAASGGNRWTFPAGTSIPAGGHLVVWCDSGRAASTTSGAAMNTGFSLPADTGDVYLLNASGQPVDWVNYGFQIADQSIGRVGGVWRLLASPTPGAANNEPVELAPVSALRLNEWMAAPASGDDWFEVYNPDPRPADLGGLFVTDDPSVTGRTRNPIAPLSFVGGGRWATFIASSAASSGRNHVNFSLNAQGETLRLYDTNLTLIDAVDFGVQTAGVSRGRLPDGAAAIVPFPDSPTPGGANFVPLATVVINEVLAHTDPPLEDAIELHNPTAAPVDIGGWYLSDTQSDLKRFRIPDGTILPAGGFRVFYENQFRPTGGGEDAPPLFSLNSAYGDSVFLSQATALGDLTGHRAGVTFGATANGVSLGRWATSTGVEFTALSARTFGQDNPTTLAQFRTGTGLLNAAPLVGPVVISEIMYHPAPTGPDDTAAADAEYVELRNITGSTVPLFDPENPANTWSLADGIQFTFPPSTSLPAGGHLLVVPFDPADAPALAAFRARHNAVGPVVGPFSGRLNNAGETVDLLRPDRPQTTPSPDAGFVPQLLVDRVAYSDLPPWPVAADGGGASLQRINVAAYGNDPANWKAEPPTAGRVNEELAGEPPVIDTPPTNLVRIVGQPAEFSVIAHGSGPLAFQWFREDAVLDGRTSLTLSFNPVSPADAGAYRVRVTNGFGAVLSAPATLTVLVPPAIAIPPVSVVTNVGGTATFTVAATGTEPLHHQWRREGVALPDGDEATFTLTSVQTTQGGGYTVVITNVAGAVTSDVVVLTVRSPPIITSEPQGDIVFVGGGARLSVSATGDAPLAYQWRFGDTILAETGPVLELTDLQVEDGGAYRVRVSNAAGFVWSEEALVEVLEGLRFTLPQRLPDGRFVSWLEGPLNHVYLLEASTNLFHWDEVTTLTLTNSPQSFIDPDAPAHGLRFYRALDVD